MLNDIMNNLSDNDLKDLFKTILYSIHFTEPVGTITFKFSDSNGVIDTFKVKYVFGNYYIKDVNIGTRETALNIILLNLHYNVFNLTNSDIFNEPSSCHGHGEYWGANHFIYNFFRF